jgi:hypothetical protein
LTVRPFPEVSEVGTEEPAGCWTTVVVVTEWLPLVPAITIAITPPATAPAMTGMILFKDLMIGFSCNDRRRGSYRQFTSEP